MVSGTRYLLPGTWYQVPGTGYQVPGTWYQVPGTWYKVPGSGYQVPGSGFQVPGTCTGYHVPGTGNEYLNSAPATCHIRNDVGAAKTILDEVEAILGCGAFEKDGHGRILAMSWVNFRFCFSRHFSNTTIFCSLNYVPRQTLFWARTGSKFL